MPIATKRSRWWLAVVAVGALALTACSGTPAPAPSGTGSADQKNYNIAWLGGLETDPYFITMQCGAQAEAKKLGVTIDWKGVNAVNNINQINQNVDSQLLANPDGFVFTATGQNDNFNVLKINKAGIPLVEVQNLSSLGQYYQAFPSSYPQDQVEAMGKMIADSTKGKGTVAVFVGLPGPTYEPRWLPMVDALSDAAPGMKILDTQYTQFDTATTSADVAATIVANPDLKVVYTSSGPEAAGAIAAVKTAGKEKDIQIYTFNATPTVIAALKSGNVQAVLTTNPRLIGENAVKSIVEHLNAIAGGGKPTVEADPHVVPSDVGLITADNVDDAKMASYLFVSKCDS